MIAEPSVALRSCDKEESKGFFCFSVHHTNIPTNSWGEDVCGHITVGVGRILDGSMETTKSREIFEEGFSPYFSNLDINIKQVARSVSLRLSGFASAPPVT